MSAASKKGRVQTVGKYFRVLIVVSLILGITALARNDVAWAGPAVKTDQSVLVQDEASVSLSGLGGDDDPGTVKPPRGKTMICKKGLYSVGGSAVLRVSKLAKHYCIKASTIKRSRASGHIPADAGKILSNVVSLQMLYRNRPIHWLPEKYGEAQICFAVPHGKHAKIYILSSFGGHTPTWRPVSTRVKNGVACASSQISGSYALIGK